MASYTTNLNLKKPSGSEAVAIGDINGNMDTIDTAYGSLNGKINSKIVEVATSFDLMPNETAILPYPTGYSVTNCKVLYACLHAGSERYYQEGYIQYTSTDGIHVKNIGGAGGTVELGITIL